MTSYPCPACHAPADLTGGCPGCGRAPDPDAAEVIRLDAELPGLLTRVNQARAAVALAESALYDARRRRDAALTRVRAALAATAVATPLAPRRSAEPGAALGHRMGAEASTRTVQNLLFLLGGLLLGTAAVVFTAVAWASYGVGVRAALLGAVTALALGAPLLALRRGLTATAETVAAVGLLLLLLDGYAAWYVDLFGLSGGSPARYAGVVALLSAAAALGYGARTGLAGPRFAALLIGQPVVPLLLAPGADFFDWSVALLLVAALDLVVLRWRSAAATPLDVALRAVTWALFGFVGLAGMLTALIELAWAPGAARVAAAGAVLVAAALLAVAAAGLARTVVARALAGAGLVVAVALAAARFCDEVGGRLTPVLIAAVLAVLAGAVVAAGGLLPAAVARGPWSGAVAALVAAGVPAALSALEAAVGSVDAARPVFTAMLNAPVTGPGDWRVPVTVALLTAGSALLLRAGTARGPVLVAGLVLVVFGLPAALSVPWWTVPALDLAIVAGLLAAAGRTARERAGLVRAVAAGVLAGHAVLTGLGRLGVTAAVLGTLVLLGVATAAAYRSGHRTGAHRRIVGGVALAVGLLAWPGALAATLAAVRVEPWWVSRGTAAAVLALVPVLAVVARRWPGYAGYALAAVLAGAVPLPGWAVLARGAEPAGGYAAVALLVIGAVIAVLPAAALTVPPLTDTDAAGSRVAGPPLAGTDAAVLQVVGPPVVGPPVVGPPVVGPPVVGPPVAADAAAATRNDGVPVPSAGTPVPRVARTSPALPAALAAALLAALVPVLWLAAELAEPLWTVLGAPYGWLDSAFGGRPGGVGLAPAPVSLPVPADAASLWLLAVALAVPIAVHSGRRAAAGWAVPVVLPAVVLTAAATAAPWPAVPAVGLLGGLGALVFAARWRAHPSAVATAVAGVVTAAAGLAGALPTRPVTLAALGLVLVAASVVGSVGRRVPVRSAGWLTAVTAGVAVALVAGSAAGLAVHHAAFGVLAVAAAASGLSVALTRRRPVEAVAVQAAAQATAVVALLLSVAEAGYAAAVCTLWGLVLGLQALWPRTRARRRRTLVVAAAATELLGWWLLLAAGQVAVVEAYTVPAAAVALLAGGLALRDRPTLSSWVIFGPALAAAFLPSLASVLLTDGQPVRRLLLGVAAVAVVSAGAAGRRQAPVVVAGGVLAVVALHELLLFWDLLPRWIPLALGGLLLVTLATTLERRRRDLARVRAAVTRMS